MLFVRIFFLSISQFIRFFVLSLYSRFKRCGNRENKMEVKDIFELRKQGRIEEAYEAIRPMYAAHQGHYTTIAMFWTASDVLKLRVSQNRVDEAAKIFQALCRLYPNLDDKDRRGNSAMLRHALRLKRGMGDGFSMIDFLSSWGFDTLSPADWMVEKNEERVFPSTAQRLLDSVIYELKQQPSPEQALKVVPILRAALAHDAQDVRHLQLKELVSKIGKG